MGETIEVLVDGGKANAGPLAPALGPAGVNVGEVVAAINEKTKEFVGMQVPVKVELDDKKNYTISVGTPPARKSDGGGHRIAAGGEIHRLGAENRRYGVRTRRLFEQCLYDLPGIGPHPY